MPSTASADPGRGGVLKPAKIRLERWNDWSLQTVGARRAELVRAAAAGVEAGFQSPVAGAATGVPRRGDQDGRGRAGGAWAH